MASGGFYVCKPVDGTQCHKKLYKRCTLHAQCREHRCRTHCWCARNGKLTGRNCGRRDRPQAKPLAKPQAKPKAQPQPSPQPRPSLEDDLSVRVFTDGSWVQNAAREIAKARSVVVASYMIDSTQLSQALKTQKAKPGSTCQIIVDRGEHENKTCRGQAPVLNELSAAGAEIYLCYGRHGTAKRGSMHAKCLVIDRRVAWWGSSNYTKNSNNSWELVTRGTGAPVQKILDYLLSLRRVKGTILMTD